MAYFRVRWFYYYLYYLQAVALIRFPISVESRPPSIEYGILYYLL
jgi:hypothetical protein